ncbi:MAG: 3-oxoacyl-[acyl-carrier-protein] synthase 2 [Candidatus Hinthialibacteria bacterium]|nr:3-oxoacyl-[acyl-carrier-protein] synthase 2 [bacterium]
MSVRVVVTGMGAVAPIGIGVDQFWSGLSEGVSGAGTITYFNSEAYATRIACEVKGFKPEEWVPEKEISRSDPFVWFGMAAAEMAVRDSGLLDIQGLDPTRVGVLIGTGIGGLQTIESSKEVLLEKGPRRISPFLIPMLIGNMASGMVSIRYGFKGPNMSIATACATGNHAIGEAQRIIQRGEADIMVCGGAEAAITPLGLAGFVQMKAMSRRNDSPETASRPFDKDRDGFVAGEGAGVVVLESLEHARKRGAPIYGEMAGYGQSADAFHMTAPASDGEGAQAAMRNALKDAGINPDQVDYINAHGTSTQLNDTIETAAIKSVFQDHARRLQISSTKSMTGHLLGAAGGIEFVACCLMFAHNAIPPTINYETPDPDCDLDYVPNQAREFTGDVCMSNGFGFGGHNAVLIARRFRG